MSTETTDVMLPDGTPVADVLQNLREVQADNAGLRRTLGAIKYQANRKASERADAIKQIWELLKNV